VSEIGIWIDDEQRVFLRIERDDWAGLGDPCPCCGAQTFRHFETDGGRYGVEEGRPIHRTDYWDAKKPLYTQCLNCAEVLYRHPAFELLFDTDNSELHDSLGE
jgi:hypothetical protein